MPPKLKAKELIKKFIGIMPPLQNQTGKTIVEHAKKCAIILVEEMYSDSQYWSEVKLQIENL